MRLFYLILILAICTQCNQDPKNNPDLIKANKTHLEALKMNDAAVTILESVKEIHISEGPSLASLEEGDAKRKAYDLFKSKTIKLAIEHRDWNRDIPEVPGYAASDDDSDHGHTHGDEGHSHDDGHGHHDHGDHSHGDVSEQLENLNPEEVLSMQQEFLDKMNTIKTELEKAVTEFRNVVK